MSGQASVVFEQSPPDLVDFTQETVELEQINPIAVFLEKHGSTMVTNHEGQMVTVAEAMANCPPFARLVEAMGEGALALTAAQRPEEKSEETEETEAEEESESKEDNAEQEAEVRESDKSTNNVQQEKIITKQETPKTEKLPVSGELKQNPGGAKLMANDTELVSIISSVETDTLLNETVISSSPEKAIVVSPSQEVQLPESPAVVVESSPSTESSYSEGSKDTEPTIVTQVEMLVLPQISVETQAEPLLVERVYRSPEVSRVVDVEPEHLVLQSEEESQVDEPFLGSESGIETDIDDLKIEVSDVQDDSELDTGATYKRQQTLGEFVELDISQEQIGEDFTIQNQEAPVLSRSEHIQDSPEAIAELSVPVEEVEQTILQVADNIKQMEVDETKIAYQILDELVQKIAEIQILVEEDSGNLGTAMESEDMEEDLKELFIRLFDYVEIEYSPELIESCVKLALLSDISELIARFEHENKETGTSQDIGTHEAIKQILATISSIKKSVQYAYQIGKSALQLFNQNAYAW